VSDRPGNDNDSAPADPFDLTLRALLKRLLGERAHPSDLGWVNVRVDDCPWRHLVAAAERGEVVVARVGRKLLMRRPDLDAWLESQRIEPRAAAEPREPLPPQPDRVAHVLAAHGYSRRTGARR
jgi:hypothetical protein